MSEPDVLPPSAGEALWFLDTLMQVKLGASATNGALAIFEQLAPPGSATPMHRHDTTEEHFYVLSGAVIFHGPSGARQCEAGAFVSVPRGTAHGFRVTDDGPARLLVISMPATFERFVRAVGRSAPGMTLPPAAATAEPAALERLANLGAQYDVILLGPPPPAA